MVNTVMSRRVIVDGEPIKPAELAWHEYRKKPVVVSATRMQVPFQVETLEGWMKGNPGDWLIEGIQSELYPCRDDIFCRTYEEVI